MATNFKAAPLAWSHERRPASPIPWKQPSNSRPYRVKDGDNWKSIALANGIDPSDLLRFNFGTVIPEEVNWYLREYVGCNVKTADGRNWRFSSSATPGTIYLPLTKAAIKPPTSQVESGLAILRRNVLDGVSAIKTVPLYPMHKPAFDPLTTMALKHVDNLIEMKLSKLPFPVVLFGRAFVLGDGEMLYRFPTFKSTAKNIFTGGEHPLFYRNTKTGKEIEGPALPEMSYGKPADKKGVIHTARLPAILLYESGVVVRLVPYQRGIVFHLESHAPEPWAAWNL